MDQQKVLICYNTGGNTVKRPDFYDKMFQLENPKGSLILPNHDRSPAKGRNDLVAAGKQLGVTDICLIDDDVMPPNDGLTKLLSHDVDIVTGLYLQKTWPHRPLLFDFVEEDGQALYYYLLDPPTFREFENCGLGFCLIKMEVFDKMEKPWFRLGELDVDQWCDDIGFFNRARKAGFKIHCDMTVICGHIGTQVVSAEYDKEAKKWYTVFNTDGQTNIRIPQQIPVGEYKFVRKD